MDDSLLEDDDAYKDDEVEDDLDEAALLGLSDDDLLDSPKSEQASAYGRGHIKDDFSRGSSGNYQNTDEDILEVNIDADLDSFIQEDLDNSYSEEMRRKPNSSKDLKYQENLIPITLVPTEKMPPSDVVGQEDSDSLSQGVDLLDDEESDDENFDDDRRGRFKSERSNIITLTHPKSRAIPDSLESVLNSEDRSKAQEFLENERRKKMSYKSKGFGQGGNFRNNLPKSNVQGNQRFPNQNVSHKILINPHFAKNLSIPVSTPAISIPEQQLHVGDNYGYQQQKYPQQDHSLYGLGDMFIAPPPMIDRTNCPNPEHFVIPPVHNTMVNMNHNIPATSDFQHFGPPAVTHTVNVMPPHLMQHNVVSNQPVSNVWNQPPLSYVPAQPQQVPPNYSYPQINAQQPPGFNSMPPSPYLGNNYQQPPMQPPVVKAEPFPNRPVWDQHNHMNLPKTPTFSQPIQNISARGQTPLRPQQQFHSPRQQLKRVTQVQTRKLIKRSATMQLRLEPAKQKRFEDGLRKPNFPPLKVNSNIKEIPLVENLTPIQKKVEKKPVPDDEDEATKELCMKIEEQKKLREQIMKFKEERRRQMAAQRMLNLKTQDATEQTKPSIKDRVGIVPVVLQGATTLPKKMISKPVIETKSAVKIETSAKQGVHQRIGMKTMIQFPKTSPTKNAEQTKQAEATVEKKSPLKKVAKLNTQKPPFVAKNRGTPTKKFTLSQPRFQPPPTQNADFLNPWMSFSEEIRMSGMNPPQNWMGPRGCPPERFPVQPFEERFGPPMPNHQMRFPFPPSPKRPEFPPPPRFVRPHFFPPRFDSPFNDFGRPGFEGRPFGPTRFSSQPKPFGPQHTRHNRPPFQRRLYDKNLSMTKNIGHNQADKKGIAATETTKSLKQDSVSVPVAKVEESFTENKVSTTRTVIVNNLSSSTTEIQLQKLGNSIGPVEKIELQDRKAIMIFKNCNDALKFQSKYQRYMLDLSLIDVTLQL